MLWKLIKIRLLGMFTRNAASRGKRSGKGAFVLMGCLFLYCAVVFGVMFFALFSTMAEPISLLPQYHWFYFAMVGIMSFGISFFFTAFTAKSELFEAKDNELLLSMPIRPRTILLSRMLILLGTEYLFSLLVLVPAGLAWFLGMGAEAAQLVFYILGGLFFPLLSASLASLVGWLLARLTAKARNKTLVTMILSLLFLAVYFLVYFRAQTYIRLLLQNLEATAESVAIWGFVFKWLGDAVAYVDVLKLAAIMLIAAASFALAIALISKGFLKISSADSIAGKKRRGGLVLRSSKVSSALLRRELKRFVSLPVYMMNCGLGLVFGLAAAVALVVKAADIRVLIGQLVQNEFYLSETELSLAVAVILSFLSSMDVVSAPSVSLEGKTLWIVRSAPIPARMVLSAKLRLHEYLCVPVTAVLSVAAAVVLQVGVLGWIILLLVPQLFVLLSGSFGLMMNLLLPKLDWTSETVPIKQSASVTVTILALMGLCMLSFFGFIFVVFNGFLTALAYLLIVVGIAAVWCAFCMVWLYLRGAKRFERL